MSWFASKCEDAWNFQYFSLNVRILALVSNFACNCVVPLQKYQQIVDISLGTCPTVFPSVVTATANESYSSLVLCISSPILGVRWSLYTWCPWTLLSVLNDLAVMMTHVSIVLSSRGCKSSGRSGWGKIGQRHPPVISCSQHNRMSLTGSLGCGHQLRDSCTLLPSLWHFKCLDGSEDHIASDDVIMKMMTTW